MVSVPSWVSVSILGVALASVAWLGLPSQPPQEAWPSPGDSEALLKPLLVADLSQAWKEKDFERAWGAAHLVVENYPSSSEAQRLAPQSSRLEALANQARRAAKWRYEELSSEGWGGLVQAQLTSEGLAFKPDASPSFLVVRNGSLARYQAVFVVPGVAFPPECNQSQGCILEVEHGSTQTKTRWLPVEGAEGWLQASNPGQVLSWLADGSSLAIPLPGQEEPLRFDTAGLDGARMGLQSVRPQ